jgi:hypothetical protein
MAYRSYTADGSYWTVRKHGSVYWVVRIERVNGSYRWAEVWGGYRQPGSAGGTAAQLAYMQARGHVADELRGSLHKALETVGLGPMPTPAPVKPDLSKLPPPEDVDDPED